MPTLHNARADKVATAPSWRGPFAKRRAIIPAAGYYEWLPGEDADGKPVKQPYYIHPADGVLSFAGLYELWPDPAKDADDPDRWLWSAAIITHHATWLAGVMNDRTPVILPADRIDAWLNPELTDKDAVQQLISGIEYDPLQVRAVSTASTRPAAALPGDRTLSPLSTTTATSPCSSSPPNGCPRTLSAPPPPRPRPPAGRGPCPHPADTVCAIVDHGITANVPTPISGLVGAD
jgi:putative SOS response-associated peptidase YedK